MFSRDRSGPASALPAFDTLIPNKKKMILTSTKFGDSADLSTVDSVEPTRAAVPFKKEGVGEIDCEALLRNAVYSEIDQEAVSFSSGIDQPVLSSSYAHSKNSSRDEISKHSEDQDIYFVQSPIPPTKLVTRLVFAFASVSVAVVLGLFLLSSETEPAIEAVDSVSVSNIDHQFFSSLEKDPQLSASESFVSDNEDNNDPSIEPQNRIVAEKEPNKSLNAALPLEVNPKKPAETASSVPSDTLNGDADIAIKNAASTSEVRKPVARCSDGTYSFRASPGETCSSRGGVAELLGNEPKQSSSVSKMNPPVRAYILGPRGGCYYVDGKGAKEYVAKSLCS